jgi:hypothetical protein
VGKVEEVDGITKNYLYHFPIECYIKFVILNEVKNLLLIITNRFFAIAQNDIFELAYSINCVD